MRWVVLVWRHWDVSKSLGLEVLRAWHAELFRSLYVEDMMCFGPKEVPDTISVEVLHVLSYEAPTDKINLVKKGMYPNHQ